MAKGPKITRKKKALTSDRVMLEFETSEQAKAFYEYFRETGFDDFTSNDHVHDELGVAVPQCLTSEEEPADMDYYFIQMQ